MTTVLVIEDNVDVAAMLRLLLELNASNMVVREWTDNFDQVCDVEHWDGVDVAVIDLMLPGVDGRDVCRWAAEHVPHVRRVIYTASGVVEVPYADAVIGKTADFRTVANAIGLP